MNFKLFQLFDSHLDETDLQGQKETTAHGALQSSQHEYLLDFLFSYARY
jgi:hypothetical protein